MAADEGRNSVPHSGAGGSISDRTRIGLLVVLAAFVVTGAPLYLAPTWAASRFPIEGSPFAVMTVGSWFLGGAFLAWYAVRDGRWAVMYPGLVFLGALALLEALVLGFHADDVRITVLGWIYVAALALALVVSLAAAAEARRSSAKADPVGRPVPLWVRVFTVLFLALDLYIAISLLTGVSDGGTIWPGEIPLPMARAFGAFYLALGLAVAPALVARRDGPVLWLIPGGMVGAILILIPALVYIELFDFDEEPGGLIYVGTFVGILVVEAAILAIHRTRDDDRDSAHPKPGAESAPDA